MEPVAIARRDSSLEAIPPRGGLFRVKCNQHPWEKAYIAVFDHPFFAVSSSDGSFKIDRLPPGDYDLIFWHEKFGEQRAKISLRPNESLTQDMTFGPASK